MRPERLVTTAARPVRNVPSTTIMCDSFEPLVPLLSRVGKCFLVCPCRLQRGEVCEVVAVDDEGVDVDAQAGGAEAFDIGGIGGGGAPHAGTGGENLAGVGTELVSFEGGVFEGLRAGRVDAEAQKGHRSKRAVVFRYSTEFTLDILTHPAALAEV